MKAIKFIVIAAAALVMASCNNTPKIEGVELPSAAQVDSVSYLIGVNFGYFIKANNFAENLDDLNFSQIKKGINDFINAKGQMGSEEFNSALEINPDMMQKVFGDFVAKRQSYVAAKNLAEGQAFLEKLYNKGGVQKTESGLMYEILQDGNDVKAGPTDTVYCHYTGTLIDGTQFDASDPEGDPVHFTLDRVIKGWTEGMQLVGEGGKIKLYIPSELGYGEMGAGPQIKPNSTLIFEVEITKVGKVAAAPAEEAAAPAAE